MKKTVVELYEEYPEWSLNMLADLAQVPIVEARRQLERHKVWIEESDSILKAGLFHEKLPPWFKSLLSYIRKGYKIEKVAAGMIILSKEEW